MVCKRDTRSVLDSGYGGKQIKDILSCQEIQARNPSDTLSSLLILSHDRSTSKHGSKFQNHLDNSEIHKELLMERIINPSNPSMW